MTTQKIISGLFILLLCGSNVNAQEPQADTACFTRHEFSVYGGGGLSTLLYKVTDNDRKNSLGGLFGLGYHFFFDKHWALGTGIEADLYRSRYIADNYYTSSITVDREGNPFEFRSTVSATEKQSAAMLYIPLMLQYQTAVPGRKHQFFAAAGAKAGFPISAKYKVTDATAYNTGYYEYEDYEYTTQTFMGFGQFEGKDARGDLFPRFQGIENMTFLASAEAGVKWKLNWKGDWSLYTGLYLDYGLNNIRKGSAQPYVIYNAENPADFKINSAFVSGGTDKVNPFAVGLKVRLAFGKKKCPPPPAAALPPVRPVPEKPREEPEKKKEEPVKPAEEPAVPVAEPVKPVVEPARPAPEPEPAPAKPVDKAAIAARLKPVADYIVSHAELSAVQMNKWDENIAVLNMYPDMKVFIYGHTCNLGTPAVNERLGKQRAETVKAYLLSKGIAANRILGTASKRDTEPALPNDTEAHRKDNRRVELIPQ
jgi:outer membrane protein OmpA-like peptidoglycan-associated protein